MCNIMRNFGQIEYIGDRAVKTYRAILFALGATLLNATAFADTYVGQIDMVEVWTSGNVAFSLSPAASGCNGQFILNASAAGFKNQYAAIVAAKSQGNTIKVITSGCGPADGYGGNYNLPTYLYPFWN